MITITNITKKRLKEVRQFDTRQWHKVDKEHYGRPIAEYMDKKFGFMAAEDGKVLGTISGECELGVVFIAALIVASAKRGQGVGKKLLNKAKSYGKRLGCHKMFLFTGKGWKANKFYKDLGFRKTGELKKHYLKHDFYIYEREI